MAEDPAVADLVAAARVLAGERLVSAFGHVSVRRDARRLVITPQMPLGSLAAGDAFAELSVDDHELPDGVPREAWIHLAIARARPDVKAICRAQPPVATALAAAGVPIRPLHGQGGLLGPEVPVFEDAVLIRDRRRAGRLAECLGAARAVVMRGNGAVTTGTTVGEAVALMSVLEASAEVNRVAVSAGRPRPLSREAQDAWRSASGELLERIWKSLRADHTDRWSAPITALPPGIAGEPVREAQ